MLKRSPGRISSTGTRSQTSLSKKYLSAAEPNCLSTFLCFSFKRGVQPLGSSRDRYMNACPCGFYGDATRECRCTPAMIQRYLGKISGPLLDRIDIQIEVPAVPYKELRAGEVTESSSQMLARVERARAIQSARGQMNSLMPTRLIRKQCALDETGERTLEMAMRRMSLSARAHDRILKVARTVADLDGSESIAAKHVAEAIQYRSLDRSYWN
ncbi:MAG: ATP-binding protein [Acidobacteriota bacterium]|nr:ATP-binding protein [Acidobacteriota bacterium]